MLVGVSRRYHFTPVRLAKNKMSNSTKLLGRMLGKDHFHFAHRNKNCYSLASKQSGNIYDIPSIHSTHPFHPWDSISEIEPPGGKNICRRLVLVALLGIGG